MKTKPEIICSSGFSSICPLLAVGDLYCYALGQKLSFGTIANKYTFFKFITKLCGGEN